MPNHPQRVWPLQGATNFRDLGGYPGQDGRPVRWRRLFRSDHLGGLTEADKAAARPAWGWPGPSTSAARPSVPP